MARPRKRSLAKHLDADARDFRAIDADARDIHRRVHALEARDKPLGHAGGMFASEEVGLYKTASGAVGLQIRRHTGGSRVYYSYTGKWGAGSGGSFEDMARALEVALYRKRGVKVVKDFFAHARSAPPGHAAGRRKRIDPHTEDAALEYSIPIEQAAQQVLEVARETRSFLRQNPSAGAVFDAKKRIASVYAMFADVLKRSGPGIRIAIDTIGKLPNYGEHEHPFTRARKAAAHLDRVHDEAERLRVAFGHATIGDRARVEGALDAVLAHPWAFGPGPVGHAAGRLTRADLEKHARRSWEEMVQMDPERAEMYARRVLGRRQDAPHDSVWAWSQLTMKQLSAFIGAAAAMRASHYTGFAAGRHAGATPIVWETLAKVVQDSPAVLTPEGAAIVLRANEPTFRTHINTAIKLGLLVPVAIPGRKRTDLFTIPPEHQVHLDVVHDQPVRQRPPPAITGVNAFVLQKLSIVNPDLFTEQGTEIRVSSTSAAHARRLIALRALEPVPGSKKNFRLTELGRQTLQKEAVFLRDHPHMQENLVRMREANADQIAVYLHHVFG